jgi:uncharacterized membrane protein YbhN (UPF0104 family)
LRAAGVLLSVFCVVWIVYRFVDSGLLQRVTESSYSERLVFRIAQAVPVYASGLVALGIAWWFLQGTFATQKLAVRDTFVCYGVTQFGKYLPGNVGQYLGRHVVLRGMGLSHATLTMCAITEAGLLVCASLMWSAPLIDLYLPGLPAATLLIVLPLGLLVVIAIFSVARVRIRWMENHVRHFAPAAIFVALALYLLFFAIMAMTLQLVAWTFDSQALSFVQLSAVASLSWVAGYLVIGAPGGLGVREAVFLILLHGRMPEDQILLMAAGFRVATFGGDLLLFLLVVPFNARLTRAR